MVVSKTDEIVEDHDYFLMVLKPLNIGVGKVRMNTKPLYIHVFFSFLSDLI